jgi:hypothetical protein
LLRAGTQRIPSEARRYHKLIYENNDPLHVSVAARLRKAGLFETV